MVQGGYNAVLNPNDSLERHFTDTVKGGAYLNHQELAWTLVKEAPDRIGGLLFQPSGRFLYAVDRASRLRAYAVDSDGRLELTMSIEHAGGSMAITLKDARVQEVTRSLEAES